MGKIGHSIFKSLVSFLPPVRGLKRKYWFSEPFLDGWFVWFGLGNVKYNGAEIGELYEAAYRIKQNDYKSWGKEWRAEGDRVRSVAEKLLKEGHVVSARWAFLRGYTYYRLSHMVYGPGEPEMLETFNEFDYCFTKFATLSEFPIEKVEVPFEGTKLRGYFYKSADDNEKRPTVLFLNGAETGCEDAYWWCGAAGVERGYNVLAVDVPGDMMVRVHDPDCIVKDGMEAGMMAVVDYALERPEVDPEQLVVNGISMGGYKAGRLAQFDKRVKAVIANAPMINAGRLLEALKQMAGKAAPKGLKEYVIRISWQYGISVEGRKPADLAEELVEEIWAKRFVVDPSKITCPFLTLAGENELGEEAVRQANEFDRLLASKNRAKRITVQSEGGESHCQLNNFGLQHQISFDWFDEVLGRVGSTSNARSKVPSPSLDKASA